MSHLSLPPQAETEGTAKYQGGALTWVTSFQFLSFPLKKPGK